MSFASYHENFYTNDPSDVSPDEQADFIVNVDVALSYLTAQLQLKKTKLSDP